LKWFKLLLLDDADIQEGVRDSEYLRKTKASLRDGKNSKDPIDVVADYLKLLWQHTIQSMKRERGDMGVDGLPFKVVLTVPAIWKEYAKERMHQAAEKAGILDPRACGDTTLQLVSEPEAAALATLNEFKNETHFKVCLRRL
jgi:molecular chaperone DnaK (HSP70)